MKTTNYLLFTISLFFVLLTSCKDVDTTQTMIEEDTLSGEIQTPEIKDSLPDLENLKSYANDRFKEVTVEKMNDSTFKVRGSAQIFEANLSWVVEDGHNVLKKGFATTDAGAPEWGKFDFVIDVRKKRENSTLTLVLFESSAEDGSPKHELPILLH